MVLLRNSLEFFFRYVVSAYNPRTKKFTLQYECQTIKQDGVSFEIDEDGTHEEMENVSIETVQKGMDIFQNTMAWIHAHEKKNRDVIWKSLDQKTNKCLRSEDVDLSDIDVAAQQDREG